MNDVVERVAVSPLRIWRHKVRGTVYTELETAELQDAAGNGVEEGALLTIYRGDDGKIWARRASEFGDGRFERVRPAALADASPDIGKEGKPL